MFAFVARSFDAWRRYSTAVEELSRLTDRELADIGITRSDIPRIAHEHAHQPRAEREDARWRSPPIARKHAH